MKACFHDEISLFTTGSGLLGWSKPQQNAYIERHNRTIRFSWVSKHLFDSLEQVQNYATKWPWFYKHERPHKANGGRPPLMAA